jgi:bifunctional non-homologous end joining protein LigD
MLTRSRATRARTAPKLSEYRNKRDFGSTAEPRGGDSVSGGSTLAFVVQKHEARHLHYDLRLEADGVMKSWAVPKGPSLNPAEKRLAVEVEDHPVEYNTFEGTIPRSEYGGGTVMLWDRGHYTVDGVEPGEDAGAAIRRGLATGKLSVTLHGERLRGSFALVRTNRSHAEKPHWLFFKHEDVYADPARDVTAEWTTSVDSGRSMEEIAHGGVRHRGGGGGGAPTRQNRGEKKTPPPPPGRAVAHLPSFSPMLATAGQGMPEGANWTFEPKWDGIRIVAFAAPDGTALVTRNGNDKRVQFPDVAEALKEMARALGEAFVLDGELVAMQDGEIVRFESLQARMHVADHGTARALAAEDPAALVAFDLLLRDEEVLLDEPWTRRRRALEDLLESRETDTVRLGETSADRDAMIQKARAGGWEGLIAKRTTSSYLPGKRSRDWLKVKLENQQEFVVGGWTDPRGSRPYLGALLLGYYDATGDFVYAGRTGTGLTHDRLRDLRRRLERLERKTSPFTTTPQTDGTPHWTRPRLVVNVRFNEWTRTGVLRQPVFLGLREDKDPRQVVREPAGPVAGENVESAPAVRPRELAGRARGGALRAESAQAVEQLVAIERQGGEATLRLGDQRLDVTNLRKVFYAKENLTKGDLLRYYAAMAPHILPHIKDRPLVLKRFPDGIRGASFYQQSPAETVPNGVRVEELESDEEGTQRRLVGGDLLTLLYTVQLGAVSYDPWHSRVGSLEYADYTILDLDPGPGAAFATVVEVARKVKEELDRAGLHGALKTSGSTGLHIYLPLPPRTPLEAARLVAEIVATRVAARHPEIATVERMTKRRPRGTVYVDFLQNILGKTVAGVYAARAKPGATVSTPLRWDELTDDLDLREFTVRTVPERVSDLGDLWAEAMKTRNSLKRLTAGDAAPSRS